MLFESKLSSSRLISSMSQTSYKRFLCENKEPWGLHRHVQSHRETYPQGGELSHLLCPNSLTARNTLGGKVDVNDQQCLLPHPKSRSDDAHTYLLYRRREQPMLVRTCWKESFREQVASVKSRSTQTASISLDTLFYQKCIIAREFLLPASSPVQSSCWHFFLVRTKCTGS